MSPLIIANKVSFTAKLQTGIVDVDFTMAKLKAMFCSNCSKNQPKHIHSRLNKRNL